jgi:aryl-alcohol dehydrogenase-like predicted oxidoreductase
MNAAGRLALGTVQWGMPYGISNRSGLPSADTVSELLSDARAAGVNLLDTAWAYGKAESVLGEKKAAQSGFLLVTKTRPLRGTNLGPQDAAAMVVEAFRESLEKLGAQAVYGLLVHHADDLLGACGDAVWAALQELQSEGLVRKIGCSLYSPQQFFDLRARYAMELVQLPYSIYDQRYVTSGMADVTQEQNVEVHVRSAFLQGILLSRPEQLLPGFASVRDHHQALWCAYESLGLSAVRATIGFCMACPGIDRVVVGCEDRRQLTEILAAASGPLPVGAVNSLAQLAVHDEAILNPGRWNREGTLVQTQ